MGRRKIEIKAIKDDRNRSVYVNPTPTAHSDLRPDFEILASYRHCFGSAIVLFFGSQISYRSWVLTRLLYRTFLKRKGGLFKKAHELSVLCSVDVAVIIFGHNKKLYEFSSGDINETIGRYQYVSLVQKSDLWDDLNRE